jgi:hypothetical protein
MKKYVAVAVAAVAALLFAGCADGTTTSKTIDDTAQPTVEEVTTTESVDPEPKGSYQIASCDADLKIQGQDSLIGTMRVKNTGDVTLDARVTFGWILANGSKISATPKTVKGLAAGKSKLVYFEHPATLDEVGSFQSHPGYFNSKNCRGKALIE